MKDDAPSRQIAPPNYPAFFLCWVLVSAFAVTMRWTQIATDRLVDADDHLRLVQVRDWLAGQSWFDLTQYRFQPPAGLEMHWSRLVDMPIAAGISVLRPFVGTALAEKATLIALPLLLLGATMFVVYRTAALLMDRRGAIVSTAFIAAAPVTLVQFMPLRIDHHGWQILLAGLMLYGLLLRDPRRSGAIAGLAAAAWLHVSIEGLPLVVVAAALLGIRYILKASEGSRLVAYLAGLAGGTLALLAATRLPRAWVAPYCDAVSPAYFIPMVLAAAIVWAGSRTKWMNRSGARAGLLAAAGVAAAAALLRIDPTCAASPFSTLDPLVARYWYLQVHEGLPFWHQPIGRAAVLLWLPIVAIWGSWMGYHRAADDAARKGWVTIGVLLVGAFAIAVMVFRAGGVAQLLALPGCGFVVVHYTRGAQRLRRPALRIPLTAAAGVLPLPIAPAVAIVPFQPTVNAAAAAAAIEADECANRPALAPLLSLPPSHLLAPLNVGPALLNYTRHGTLAGGYHRSNLVMRDVITAYLSTPDKAEAIVRTHRVDYVMICTTGVENVHYRKGHPNGLTARLNRGEIPAWLEPVPSASSRKLRIWRVKPVANAQRVALVR